MKDKTAVINTVKKYAVITLGCVIYSFGVALFLDANNLVTGGATGIAIIINHLLGLALGYECQFTGIIIIILNVPMFILCFIFLGKKFIVPSIFATVFSALLITLWERVIPPDFINLGKPPLIPALIGGALFGCGLGLIFRMGATTGGTDIIVKILRKKFRHIRTGIISFSIDFVIVMCSAFVFWNFELTCYTVISIVVFSAVFDWFLYGGNSAKMVYIITSREHTEAMCEKLLKELDVGATLVDGKGAYSGEDRQIIMCALKNFLYPKLRDAIKEVDKHAFMIVSSAKEIYGEGYKNPNDDEL